MNQIKTQPKHTETSVPEYSCELLMAYIAKELAKEYVKGLSANESEKLKTKFEDKENCVLQYTPDTVQKINALKA